MQSSTRRGSPMKPEATLSREVRESMLRVKARPDGNWLGKLAQRIVSHDPLGRSLGDWLRSQGTGPPHVQRIAFLEDGPEPEVRRITPLAIRGIRQRSQRDNKR